MPVIHPVIRSAVSDAARKAIASPWRHFLTFDPVLNSYGELDTAFMPAGDFEIEVTFLLNSLTGDLVFVSDGVAGDEEWLRIDATNGSPDLNLTVVI